MVKTKTRTITKGKYKYVISEVTRDDRSNFYVARRSDSKAKVGRVYQTKRNLIAHYRTIASDIEEAF